VNVVKHTPTITKWQGKKSFTDSASGPFIIDPLKLLFAMLNLRVFEIGFVVYRKTVWDGETDKYRGIPLYTPRVSQKIIIIKRNTRIILFKRFSSLSSFLFFLTETAHTMPRRLFGFFFHKNSPYPRITPPSLHSQWEIKFKYIQRLPR